jgi:leucyl/phenylalanyl-tRNA--protein transferase
MIFPHPFQSDEDGLLAFGGDLTPSTLVTAYRWGIFPWYSNPPILWWFTNPRCIIYPSKVKISKSMRSYFNQNKFQVTVDSCFKKVLDQCAQIPRKDQASTWISKDMISAYSLLFQQGYAHSIEVWYNEELVGGLYGLSIGKIFYGESMFSKMSNASKFGFIVLCRYLEKQGCLLIDCQQETEHLKSMGAESISKEKFISHLKTNMRHKDLSINWEKKLL